MYTSRRVFSRGGIWLVTVLAMISQLLPHGIYRLEPFLNNCLSRVQWKKYQIQTKAFTSINCYYVITCFPVSIFSLTRQFFPEKAYGNVQPSYDIFSKNVISLDTFIICKTLFLLSSLSFTVEICSHPCLQCISQEGFFVFPFGAIQLYDELSIKRFHVDLGQF